MQAIIVKYIGPTNTRGSRLKAYADAGSVTISYPHELNREDGYRKAAEALRTKLGWTGEHYGDLVSGGLPKNGGTVFVFGKF
jgi:hypothetical protein